MSRPHFRAHGDVLQVRIRAAQPPRRRHRLLEVGVDAAILWRDRPRQRVQVRRLQLRQLPVLEDRIDDRVRLAQPLQRALIGAVALLHAARGRQPQFLEKHIAQLLRAADVELVAHVLIDGRLRRLDLPDQPLRDIAQHADVDPHPDRLHLRQHGHQRKLHLLVQLHWPRS